MIRAFGKKAYSFSTQVSKKCNKFLPVNTCLPPLLQVPRYDWCDIVTHSTAAAAKSPVQYETITSRLPVPSLESTLAKYLRSVKPFLSDQEYNVTRKVVQEFSAENGIGRKLQSLLEERALKTENWLRDWWLKVAYLGYRFPVLVHSSPAIQLPTQSFVSEENYLTFAGQMILGALDYKRLIDENKIPQEWLGKHPVDMTQYKKMFGTYRIPALPQDMLVHLLFPSRHIVIAHNNEFFEVTVLDENLKPLTENQIIGQLRYILTESQKPGTPVGILTSENRDVWAKYYQMLMKDPENKVPLRIIEQSLFVLCLDGPASDAGVPNVKTLAAKQLLHGGGSRANGGNRWYDKMVQLVVGSGGEAGIVYEHTAAEGGPPANLIDHILVFANKNGPEANVDVQALTFPVPKKLEFKLTSEVEAGIEKAKSNLDTLVNDVDLYCDAFSDFGKNELKTLKVSPDSFIQMAIQLAFYRLHKQPGAHYESGSIRRFIDGRTETIRSCSVESINFAQKFTSRNTTQDEKFQALKAAIDYHRKLAMEAVSGEGVDRHLLGLKLIAAENGIKLPEFFQDPSYTRSTHFRLSTSQIPLNCDGLVSFGAVVPDGYGICYNPRPASINFSVSAFNSDPETNAKLLYEALHSSLQEMRDVLARGTRLTSKL